MLDPENWPARIRQRLPVAGWVNKYLKPKAG
jgi:hypothetical protein